MDKGAEQTAAEARLPPQASRALASPGQLAPLEHMCLPVTTRRGASQNPLQNPRQVFILWGRIPPFSQRTDLIVLYFSPIPRLFIPLHSIPTHSPQPPPSAYALGFIPRPSVSSSCLAFTSIPADPAPPSPHPLPAPSLPQSYLVKQGTPHHHHVSHPFTPRFPFSLPGLLWPLPLPASSSLPA